MTKSIQERAFDRAIADWNSRSAVYLTNGSFSSDKPIFDRDMVFYPRYFYITNQDDILFLQAYNQKIRELIKKHGTPEWSPVNLIPERSFALQILNKWGQPLSNYIYQNIKERNLVHSVLNTWKKTQPIIWCRNKDRNLLLFGGDLSAKAARVDILETSDRRWLATFEFLRKHNPQLPWDNLINEAAKINLE